MRRGSAAHNPGVSLFPFLAVLICTMGVMMLLLVIINRPGAAALDDSTPPADAVFEEGGTGSAASLASANGSGGGAAADAKSKAAAADEKLESDRQMLEWRVSQLDIAREKTMGDLRNERLRLTTVEDGMRALREQWERVKKMAGNIEQADKAKDHDTQEIAAAIERLKSILNATHDQIGKAIDAARHQPPAYAIVPYDGTNGTRRQPIYIECRSDAVVLQPEGIVLTAHDFKGPKGPGNPLASTIRAARDYLAGGSAPTPGREPYPLLIVRSDGIQAFYMARAAMASWASDFGYELVEADRKIVFQQPLPQLAAIERAALADARARYAWFATTDTGKQEDEPLHPSMFRASPTGGIRPEGQATLADGDGTGSGSGFGGNGFDGGGNGSSGNGTGGNGTGTGGNGFGTSRFASTGTGSGYGAGTGTGNGGTGLGGTGYGAGYGGTGTGGGYGPAGAGTGGGNGTSGYGGIGNGGNGFGGAGNGGIAGGGVGGNGPSGSGAVGGTVIGSGAGGSGIGPGGNSLAGAPGGQAYVPGSNYIGLPGTGGQAGSGYDSAGTGYGIGGAANGTNSGTGNGAANGIGNGTGNGIGGPGIGTGAAGTGGTSFVGLPGSGTAGTAGYGGTGTGGASTGGTGVPGNSLATTSSNGGYLGGTYPNGAYPSGTQSAGTGSSTGQAGSYTGQSGSYGTAGTAGNMTNSGNAPGDSSSPPGTQNSPSGNITLAQTGGQNRPPSDSTNTDDGSGSPGGMSMMMQNSAQQPKQNSDIYNTLTTPYPSPSSQQGPHPGEYVNTPPPQNAPDKPKPQDDPSRTHDSLAEKRGRNWSLPSTAKLSTPVSRVIHVECRGDCLILKPDFGNPQPRVIRFGPRTADSVDKLVAAVWDYTKGWGIAGRQMYWKPRLELELGLSGEGRFAELQALMANSGLEISRRPTTATAAANMTQRR